MLTLYVATDPAAEKHSVERLALGSEAGEMPPAVWYDLLDPTPQEITRVQRALGIELPSREEMQEIEVSSRLYEEDGAVFTTASIMTKLDSGRPETHAITFVLSRKALVTVRYADPLPFIMYANRVQRSPQLAGSPDMVWIGLIETIVDRVADVLEKQGADIERVGLNVFDRTDQRKRQGDALEQALSSIGTAGTIVSGITESLMTLNRAAIFASNAAPWMKKDARTHIKSLTRDIKSLQDHAAFLAQKTAFLLDATLGLINIEQNVIIKIFTVASVGFLPPTLIGTIYGMNFEKMPELSWSFGYPLAIILMILSAVVPFVLFKRKGWI